MALPELAGISQRSTDRLAGLGGEEEQGERGKEGSGQHGGGREGRELHFFKHIAAAV